MALDAQALAKLAALTDGQLADDIVAPAKDAAAAAVDRSGEDEAAAAAPRDPSERIWQTLVEATERECGVAAAQLGEDTRLIEDLDCDDLQRYVLVTAIEHECSLRLTDAAVDAALTLGDLRAAALDALG